MVTTIEIAEGPGEVDFITSLLRGGIVKIAAQDGKKYRVRIAERKSWDLAGEQIELIPGRWTPLHTGSTYSPRLRKGQLVPEETEKHPICGHEVPRGLRYCNQCGRDRMEVG